MIKEYLISCRTQIEERKKAEVNTISRKVQAEKIVPFCAGIDEAKNKAIAEMRKKMNEEILALQQNFEADCKKLETASEEKKKSHADTLIATETARVAAQFDREISKLNKQIDDLEE